MNLKKLFGIRLKELRKSKGLTQFDIAELVGIDEKHISHIETGRSFPKADLIEKLAKALNIKIDEFMNFSYIQPKDELIDKLVTIIKTTDEEKLRTIYKIITAYLH